MIFQQEKAMKKNLPSKKKHLQSEEVLNLRFSKNDVTLCPTPLGINISMKEGIVEGEPGAPALPRKEIRIALPRGHAFKRLRTNVGATVLLTHTPGLVSSIQKPTLAKREGLPYLEYKRSFNVPDRTEYLNALESGKKVCRFAAEEMMGLIPVVVINVWPVRMTGEGLLELVEEITLTVISEPSRRMLLKEKEILQRLSENRIVRRHLQTHDLVLNKSIVQKELRKSITRLKQALKKQPGFNKKSGSPALIQPPDLCDYLIITDNNKWNAATMQITGTAGDLVSKFQTLANWKKSRGLRTYIAQVKDIAENRYGDFKTGARDLQEVIRNFLKWFCRSRGVDFVLLGGDVSIIPARQVAGTAWGQVWPGTFDEKNKSVWYGSFLGMRIETKDLGQSTHILTNYETGQIIPFDSLGTSSTTTPGWYHTTDNSFNTRTNTNTEWVRVNGPANQVNAKMVWFTPMNLIPTDFYYSSLYGSGYSVPGKHDFDHLDNGLYGQHNAAKSFDGVEYHTDVCIGRAPVESLVEAETFVNKVMEYEKWGSVPRPASDFDRFRSMLFVAATWNAYIRVQPDPNHKDPPDDKYYAPHGGYSLLRCDTLPPDVGDQVICYFDDQYYHRLNFRMDAGHGNPGWYYANSPTDVTPSKMILDFIFFQQEFPVPTPWIVVWDDNPDVIHPMYYAIDFSDLDNALVEQETLREDIQGVFPDITNIERLYTDEADMNPAEVAETWLRHLTSQNLEDALNRGPHFVSLSGHGNSDWVAYLETALVNRLTNGSKTSIMFADSCLTGQFDVNDSVAEATLKHTGGSAVAYVGNSRFSWVGTGAIFRELFFMRMQSTRHLGEMNDSRLDLLAGTTGWHREARIWCIFVQHLFGDPEMPVYRTIAEARNYYIGNYNTGELHDCRCQWVDRMSLHHKVYFNTLQEGLNAEYDGCGFCLKQYSTR